MVTAPTAAPSVSAAEAAPFRPPLRFELPTELQQVESDPEKVRAAEQHEGKDEESRPRRVRPVAKPLSDEPLVQVETGESSAPGAGAPTRTQPG
jgi:hypothetical protein